MQAHNASEHAVSLLPCYFRKKRDLKKKFSLIVDTMTQNRNACNGWKWLTTFPTSNNISVCLCETPHVTWRVKPLSFVCLSSLSLSRATDEQQREQESSNYSHPATKTGLPQNKERPGALHLCRASPIQYSGMVSWSAWINVLSRYDFMLVLWMP